ncbi:fimbrillin family protein [Bacteroides timonensis]|uniref:fimbrillin family protein n=1 Tax=Bacteroides timonensis TaxID=1470345 RepID=UPI0004B2D915|nr:fimbrillin family protein [Bacteroides timonensis]
MNKINLYASAATLLVLLIWTTVACRDDDRTPDGTGNGRQLNFGTLSTRTGNEVSTGFEAGATLCAYLSCGGNAPQIATLTYHKDGGGDGYWSSDPALYWQSTTQTTILTVYQEVGALGNVSDGKRPFTLTATNKENWKKLDVVAKSTSVSTSPLPPITLEHCMAMVKVTLASTDIDLSSVSGVTVKMTLPTQGELSLTDGTVSRQAESTTADIAFCQLNAGTQEFYALALPGSTGTREIIITVNGINFKYTASEEISLAAGKCSTYALKLNLNGVVMINTKVEGWEEVSAEGTTSNDVQFLEASEGGLTAQLAALPEAQKGIKKIGITGKMDSNDVAALNKYIKDNNITDLTLLTENGFPSNDCYKDCTSLKNVVLGEAFTSVRAGAFDGCTALESVNTSNVTDIGNSAFKGCSSLKSVDLQHIKVLPSGAFEGCIKLEEVGVREI